MNDRTEDQRAVEIAEALLKKGFCPFDGNHFSSLARAACEACNPPKAKRDPPKDWPK